jgi:hypothetical protein
METTKEAAKTKLHAGVQEILTEEFYNTTNTFERQAVIKMAREYGYDELVMNLSNNIKVNTSK